MNVDRRTAAGILNPYEVQQNQIFITSAGTKNSYAYQRLIELLELSIISPKTAFVWGCSYKIPLMHGLLNKQYINDIKMSATFNDSSFAREYLSQWTGGGNESWFNYDRLFGYRKLVNPENTQKIIKGSDVFYILSVDVGRISCQTVVSVFKVFRHQEHFDVSLVNIYILGLTETTKHFSVQSLDLKKIIARFNPEEIVIDGNGLGVGLLDAMTQEQIDPETNEFYPGYCSFNNDDYRQALYPRAIPKIYVLKSNNTLDSKIHSNCYTKVYSGQVKFLAPELQIKNRLLETEKGQKMSVEQRIRRILPHELTTKLHEEMSNFRLSTTGNGLDIKLQKINTHMLSDKFSSFEYGLWRIKELEDEYYTKKRRKGGRQRKLVFFTEGGGS